MNIGIRIREIRRKLDINQAAFAQLIGVTQQAVSFYENGKYEPDAEALEKIAIAGGVSLDWLMTGKTGEEKGRLFRGVQELKTIPIVSKVAAGLDPALIYHTEDIIGHLLVPESLSRYFALAVEGDSMSNQGATRTINEGDYVIVDQDAQPLPGDVVVLIAGGRQLVKQLINKNGHYILKSWNPTYPDIILLQDEIEVMKRVVAIQPKMIRF